MNKVALKFQIPVSILKEDKKYVAYTPALDLSTSGKSYQEVKKRFSEIVNIFFEELIEKGTLEEVLQNLGWKKVQSGWDPPIVVAQESQTVQVAMR
ncbi:MAG TPA: type II toxin-antitoxin system HicB family antitoxin [Candidatus Paceibacterota bacterium]|jgi:predicted RNase H-like HicB family nuclease|nr:type II toxin-antitoxin system HicB family antitoxin [Candidatus Paceibacterota bacterium]HPQ23246.1 type II toxin-antitoxin system HicB family antitoxin [Candidatus Paceibacterota bacterium]